jgi:hypothetical protein
MSKHFHCLGIIVLLVTGCVANGNNSPSNQTSPPVSPASPPTYPTYSLDYFGMTSQNDMGGRPWPDVPVGVLRTFDSIWFEVEPEKGTWTFSRLDSDVALAQKSGGQIDLILSSTPTWASLQPTQPSYPGEPLGQAAGPANIQDWITYVQTIATRYKGVVHDYECWNEPDNINSYTGTVEQLIAMCQAAHSTLKEIDPSITFSSPAFMWWFSPLVESYFSSGGIGSFDTLNFHYSRDCSNPETLAPWVANYKALFAKYHLQSVPIWVSEFPYYVLSGPDAKWPEPASAFPPGSCPLDMHTSQEYVARMYIIGRTLGLYRIQWYAWADHLSAIVDDAGETDKPTTDAYRTVANWLMNTALVSSSRDAQGTWIVVIQTPGGNEEHILWNDEEATFTTAIPSTWNVQSAQDVAGISYAISSGNIPVSGMPVFLK